MQTQISFQGLRERCATIGDMQKFVEQARGLEETEGVMIQLTNIRVAADTGVSESFAEDLIQELGR